MSESEKPVYFTPEGRPVYPSETEALLRQQRQRDFELAQSLEPRRAEGTSRGYSPEVQKLINEMPVRQANGEGKQAIRRGQVIEMPRHYPPVKEKPPEEKKAA